MNTGNIVAIIGGSIAAVVVIVILVYVGITINNNNTQTQYCENWYNSLDDRRIQLENQIVEYNNAGFLEQMQMDPDYLNSQSMALDQEGNQYNKECAY